nr:syntaxin 16-like protein [Parasacculina yatsui]
MTTRSLTDVFLLMRNSAQQSPYRPLSVSAYDDDVEADARTALVPPSCRGVEPPAWLARVDWLLARCEHVHQQLQRLREVRGRQLARPATFSDEQPEEERAGQLEQQVSQQLGDCRRQLQLLREAVGAAGDGAVSRLGQRVVLALVQRVQRLGAEFGSAQAEYLDARRQREQRTRSYFHEPESPAPSTAADLQFLGGAPLSQQQLAELEEETRALQQRDSEVQRLVHSLADLNLLFTELGRLVHEQGVVVDRIDVAVEDTQTRVHDALQQLQKADSYQNKSRRLQILLALVVITVLLIVVLLLSK